jgi:hypothetical protein
MGLCCSAFPFSETMVVVTEVHSSQENRPVEEPPACLTALESTECQVAQAPADSQSCAEEGAAHPESLHGELLYTVEDVCESGAAAMESESEALPQALSPEPVTPSLAGSWHLVPGSWQGLEDMMTLEGMGFLARKAASKMVAMTAPTLEILFDGDLFVITASNARGSDVKRFRADGQPWSGTFGPEKRQGTATASWEADSLVLRADYEDRRMEVKRTLQEDGSLLEEVSQHKGTRTATMSRVWRRAA